MDTIEDTSGFYRLNPDTEETNPDFYLQYAPNFVYGPGYSLKIEEKDTYSYPTQGGWYWCASENAARLFFNLPPKE